MSFPLLPPLLSATPDANPVTAFTVRLECLLRPQASLGHTLVSDRQYHDDL